MNDKCEKFPPPAWVKESIFYQIFPDRFARSKNHHCDGKFSPWGALPTISNFCGGNLEGIREKISYFEDLGINAIYLCPIFQSPANHRYHTYDYFKIDPVLGTEAHFDSLVEDLHKKNIRLILDGVFNHASRGFFQFASLLELGSDSPYKNWFHIESFPVQAYSGKPNYKCWWNMPALPKFNTDEKEVRAFLFSVAEFWMKRGIDGFRLDVPNEIDDDEFWREFRTRLKKINREAYIVGEIWDHPARWLQGDQFDGVMNYPLRRKILDFILPIRKHSKEEIQEFCTFLEKNFDENLFGIPMNLLSSHDTRRLISQPNSDFSILKLFYALLFFLPGAPSIYYGEEIAMEGGKDPDNRRCFPWGTSLSKENNEHWHFIKRLIALRRKEKALRHGALKAIPGNDSFIIRRIFKEKTIDLEIRLGKSSQETSFSIQNGNESF